MARHISLNLFPSLATYTTNRIIVVPIVVVEIAIVWIEIPRIISIVGNNRRGPLNQQSTLFNSLKKITTQGLILICLCNFNK